MIGYLNGKVLFFDEQQVIVDTGGVGYEVYLGDSGDQSLIIDKEVSLWIYTHVREDQITLFGFKELIGKKLFLLLMTVSGVGPKLSMAIVTQMQPQDLLDAITFGNVKALCRVSGVGRKVADRLILELKDKLGQVLDLYEVSPSQTPAEVSIWRDLTNALAGLGFADIKIRNVIKLARQNYAGQSVDLNVVLKFALKKIKDC